jgi:hypothetical protein
MEIGNCAYIVIEDSTAQGLMLQVNALIKIGWFLIGGLSHGPEIYAQAMGFRGTPPDDILRRIENAKSR